MSELSQSELRRLDVTLLLVLLGLIRRRKASLTALDLGLTPSAVSQALKRLRDIFSDELFLRRPHGLEPTALALALEAPVALAVESLRGALVAAKEFDPAAAEGVISIAALDAEQAVLVPPLAARLQRCAPGLRVSVLPLGRGDALEALASGRADLALGFIRAAPEAIASAELYQESFRVAGRPDALPLAPSISLEAYCAADHVLISPGGDLRGIVDAHLESLGRTRRIVLGLPAFLPAMAAVARSGALVTMPSRVAAAFAESFGLVLAEPPMEVRRFPVSAFWHRRNNSDARMLWLKRQLAESF